MFQERKWIPAVKVCVDIIALQLSLYLAWLTRGFLSYWWPLEMSNQTYWDLALGMLIIPLGYWLVRIYPGYGLTTAERLRRRIRATFVIFMIFATSDVLLDHTSRSRGIMLLAFVFCLIFPTIIQSFVRRIFIKSQVWGIPVIIIGAGKTGEYIVKSLIKDSDLGMIPVAILDDDPNKKGNSIAGVPVVGDLSNASRYIGKVNCALIAIPGAGRELVVELSHSLPFFNITIIPDLIGLQSLWVEARDLGGIIGLEIQKNLLLRRNIFMKKIMDYTLGIPLFLISIPILAFISIWIFIVSPGNPFYCQIREGINGKKFKVWKLRTMYPHADTILHAYLDSNPDAMIEWKTFFKLKKDPRIIKYIGSFLRKSSLDELPQLWNVLCGEMSLVGPRPFPHYHLEEFNTDFRLLRRSVMPGMTGLWQVSDRSNGDLSRQESLDTYYIRNWSIWMDFDLLARTFTVVLTGKGAC